MKDVVLGSIIVIIFLLLVYVPHVRVFGRYFGHLTDKKIFKYLAPIFPTAVVISLFTHKSDLFQMYKDIFAFIVLVLFLITGAFFS